jgi:hypothetical protein
MYLTRIKPIKNGTTVWYNEYMTFKIAERDGVFDLYMVDRLVETLQNDEDGYTNVWIKLHSNLPSLDNAIYMYDKYYI